MINPTFNFINNRYKKMSSIFSDKRRNKFPKIPGIFTATFNKTFENPMLERNILA